MTSAPIPQIRFAHSHDGTRLSTSRSNAARVMREFARIDVTALLPGLSEKTVRNHATAIFDRIEVITRAQAIVLARESGFGQTSR